MTRYNEHLNITNISILQLIAQILWQTSVTNKMLAVFVTF